MNRTELDKLLDKTKIHALVGKEAAFLGTLMTKLNFEWDDTIEAAAVNSSNFRWNPEWFLELKPEVRVTVLMHELWHIARLHAIRRMNRDKKYWNVACDIKINNDLLADGYSFDGSGGIVLTKYKDMTEEEIYDEIYMKPPDKVPQNPWGKDSPDFDDNEEEISLVAKVQSARIFAKSQGKLKAGLEQIIDQFTKPQVNWRTVLRSFFTDLIRNDYSWKRPNRRYEDIYLPSLHDEEGRLEVLNYYIDTSGSISEEELQKFNTELKAICEDIKPKRLVVINFDEEIQKEIEIDTFRPFENLSFKGRGGTDLYCVYKHIKKTKPTAAIIFTDLFCDPMEPVKTPIIWIVTQNPNAKVRCGKKIDIN